MRKQDSGQLPLFQAGSPVSPSRSPDSEQARKMTVTSGLKCSELSKNSGPLGSLVRMCLGSSIWHSTRCYLTWTAKGTPRRRLLFQLVPWTRRTDETEYSFWPTPSTGAALCGGTGNFQTLQRMAERGLITEEERRQLSQGNGGNTNPELLEWLMGYEAQFTKLIPTPTATDYRGGCLSRYWRPCSQIRNVEREREREQEGLRRTSEKPCGSHPAWENWIPEPGVGRVADGIPDRVERIKALGNAVVPQQAYPFFYLIAKIESEKNYEKSESYE